MEEGGGWAAKTFLNSNNLVLITLGIKGS